MSILTSAAASTLPSLPIAWKEFQSTNQLNRSSSQFRPVASGRGQPVESVIAYNTHRHSYNAIHDSRSCGACGQELSGSKGSHPHRLGVIENPNTPSKESPPNSFEPQLSIDVLVQ